MSAIPITLTGTIATEPAARTLPSGRACASFRLAVNHWRVDKETGEFLDDGTSWFSVDCYGDLASNSSMTLRPGTAVVVTGSLKIRQWENGERSGIAPTVVAEHIGPDLRYGTAHYRRSKAPDRGQNQERQPSEATEPAQDDVWGGMGARTAGASGGSVVEQSGYSSPVPAEPASADENGDDVDHSAAVGRDDGDRADDQSDGNPAADAGDDAIARETAAAAAPF